MLKIIYEEGGTAFSDFGLLQQAKSIITHYRENSNEVCTVKVSTEDILDALRLCVLKGDISYSEICFIINGEVIEIDAKANYTRLPSMAFDNISDILREIRELRKGKNGFSK